MAIWMGAGNQTQDNKASLGARIFGWAGLLAAKARGLAPSVVADRLAADANASVVSSQIVARLRGGLGRSNPGMVDRVLSSTWDVHGQKAFEMWRWPRDVGVWRKRKVTTR